MGHHFTFGTCKHGSVAHGSICELALVARQYAGPLKTQPDALDFTFQCLVPNCVQFKVAECFLVFQQCLSVLILNMTVPRSLVKQKYFQNRERLRSKIISTLCIIITRYKFDTSFCILICSKIMFGSYQTVWKPQNCYYPNIHHRVGSNLFAHMLFSCSFQTLVLLTQSRSFVAKMNSEQSSIAVVHINTLCQYLVR